MANESSRNEVSRKGVVRLLFHGVNADIPGVDNPVSFTVLETTPKADGEHRYFGAGEVVAGKPWVMPLHTDVEWPTDAITESEVTGPVMALHFRVCPAVTKFSVMAGQEGAEAAGGFFGDVVDWAESIGYEVLAVPEDDEFEEVK